MSVKNQLFSMPLPTDSFVDYSDGKILIHASDKIYALCHESDTLEAWMRDKNGPRPFLPPDRLMRAKCAERALKTDWLRQPLLPFMEEGRIQGRRLRDQAYLAFYRSFPRQVLKTAVAFRERHWAMLRFAHHGRDRGASGLAAACPALALALANHWAFQKGARGHGDFSFLDWISKKQRNAWGWLGFPQQESFAKFMRRLPPEWVSMTLLKGIRRAALAHPESFGMLRHINPPSREALLIAVDPDLAPFCTPKLLEEAAARPDGARVRAQFKDTARMAFQLNRAPVPLAGIRALFELHDDLTREITFLRKHENVTLPGPPFPGHIDMGRDLVILPLDDCRKIWREGREMRHCCGSYIGMVAEGGTYLYAVRAGDERATLEICRRQRIRWHVNQVRGKRNESVSDGVRSAIRQWLQRIEDMRMEEIQNRLVGEVGRAPAPRQLNAGQMMNMQREIARRVPSLTWWGNDGAGDDPDVPF